MRIIDSHLDLAWNALGFDRDLTLPLDELNAQEAHVTDASARGRATVCFPAMRQAGIDVCLGTLLARSMPTRVTARLIEQNIAEVNAQPTRLPEAGAKRIDLDSGNPGIAHAIAHGQLAWYQLMERRGHVRLIRTAAELDAHWQDPQDRLGIVVAMEGADPITSPDELAHWFEAGLRVVGPVHYGQNAYAVGTGFDGPLTDAGRALLNAADQLGVIIDLTHLSDTSLTQALDHFPGRVIASHHNCRALVPGDRQLCDEHIDRLIERDAVIGCALDAWMLAPGYVIGEPTPPSLTLGAAADHIDYICQRVGNARHVALGTDLDGGFGHEQTPTDLKSIADLRKLIDLLEARGYSQADREAICCGNWLRVLRESLPQT